MNMLEFIQTRRDGGRHSEEDIKAFVAALTKAELPDYQVSAWLMAAFFQPLSLDETTWLTQAMAASGETLDLTGLPKPWVDKHSTGGVGDKTTIVLLPLLAACGLTMVKMSGRGLGITGGTVDKLESIPGFRTDLSPDEMIAQARRIGIAWTGQTPNLAPADKILYALRDATATVENIPLIVSSILSKKIAGGADVIELDVKCGSGAFMKDLKTAKALAQSLSEVAKRCGKEVHAVVTDMDQPLGRTVGNALEIVEAIEVLKGEKGRFRDLCVDLARRTLTITGKDPRLAGELLDNGKAFAKFKEWVEAQGGDPVIADDPSRLPVAPVIQEVLWQGDSGYAARVDAGAVGLAVVRLGGGRESKADRIDPSVGVEVRIEVGEPIKQGQPVFRVHAASETAAQEAAISLESAIKVSPQPVEMRPLVLAEF
ncbi:MAG: thymidine phosphorylase [Armatimonadetes bacterium]|nr:thymidine phosphorylase [Armatimonadota bacterium]